MIQNINTGTAANTGNGDSARIAGQKINANFQYLEALLNNGTPVENQYNIPPNNTVAAMIADQANQSIGRFQFVQDARTTTEIANNDAVYYAYYEYLGTTNEDATDYRVLVAAEVAAVQNDLGYLNKLVKVKATSFANYNNMANGFVFALEADSKITALIFDADYSKYLLKDKALLEAGKNIVFKFANKTQNTQFYAEILSFELVENDTYIKANFSNDIPTTDLVLQDTLQCFLPIVTTSGGGKKIFIATTNDQENFTFLNTDTPFNPRIVIVDGIATEDYTYNINTNTLTITDGVFNGAKISLIQ